MSFNTFGTKKKIWGGHTPVWLGTVSPVPFGGVLANDYLKNDIVIPAGTPMSLNPDNNGTIKPLLAFVITAVSQESATGDTITVKPCFGFAPSTASVLMKCGASIDATGKAYKPISVSVNASDPSLLDLSYAYQKLGVLAVGDVLIEGAAEGDAASPAVIPNGYLYNDICTNDIDVNEEGAAATGAIVKFHGEGMLAARNHVVAALADKLKSLIPNVTLVKGA